MSQNSQSITNDLVNRKIVNYARDAFSSAYQEALVQNESVHEISNGVLYQVFQDGGRVKISSVAPKVPNKVNRNYVLKA